MSDRSGKRGIGGRVGRLGVVPRRCFLGYVAVAAGSLCGCHGSGSGGDPAGGAGRQAIRATATVGMIADLVRKVGGQFVQVHQIMGAGTDPHLYKASRDDAAVILQSDIVFYNGLLLEGKMAELLEKISHQKRTVAVAEMLPAERLLDAPEAPGHKDPHVWMDVSLWSEAVPVIADELSGLDPEHAVEFQANADWLRGELEQLHSYGLEMIGCIPEAQRVLVTSHDAFRYFGRAYGIEVEAVQGISTESEAGLARINALVDLIVERKIRAVFVESSVPQKSIRAIISGAASRGHQVAVGGTLYSDAMGPEGTYEGTYVGMLDHNITTVARQLGCETTPPGGFRQWKEKTA